MIIAVSQRNDKNKYGQAMDSLENSYPSYFSRFGMQLVPIPNAAPDIRKYFAEIPFSGVILSGGNDVDPKLYGQEEKEGMAISGIRDLTERELIKIAIEKDIPVLGICRGMQFINVHYGGQLIELDREKQNHVRVDHRIKIAEKPYARELGRFAKVNSYHSRGIDCGALGAGLRVFAETKDGLIEGIYHPKLKIAGIMWHPERENPSPKFNEKIIRGFLEGRLFWK